MLPPGLFFKHFLCFLLPASAEPGHAYAKPTLSAFSAVGGTGGNTLAKRLGEIETETDHLRIQLGEVEDRLRALTAAQHQVERVTRLLDSFGELWDALVLQEQRELLHLLVERVVVDLDAGGFRVEFREVHAALAPPHDDGARDPLEGAAQ